MKFAENYIKTSESPIHLITSVDENGDECYFFLMASKFKIEQLKNINTGNVDLTNYGIIVASGFGIKPMPETLLMLKEKYNYTYEAA